PALTALAVEPTIVDDPAALAAVVAECRRARLVALDTETSALDPMRAEIVGMSLAGAPGRSWYLPFAHVAPDGALAGGTPPRNPPPPASEALRPLDRKSTRLNSSHVAISYADFCLKKKNTTTIQTPSN